MFSSKVRNVNKKGQMDLPVILNFENSLISLAPWCWDLKSKYNFKGTLEATLYV